MIILSLLSEKKNKAPYNVRWLVNQKSWKAYHYRVWEIPKLLSWYLDCNINETKINVILIWKAEI